MKRYFILDEKYDDEKKQNLIEEFVEEATDGENAKLKALLQWHHLTDSEKKKRVITACYGTDEDYKELSSYGVYK